MWRFSMSNKIRMVFNIPLALSDKKSGLNRLKFYVISCVRCVKNFSSMESLSNFYSRLSPGENYLNSIPYSSIGLFCRNIIEPGCILHFYLV
jgi:hypothetical protein